MLTLTKKQARKLIVLSNDFHHSKKLKSAQATFKSIQSLGYVQLDTISVVNRAHLHVLWSRNHNFKESHLDVLYQQRKVFEYWSHAAAILPMQDYQYSLIRKNQIANGDVHWFKQKPKLMSEVLSVIATEGAKKSSDFKQDKKNNKGWWDWKPAKIALEQLFMEGQLMVEKRQNFHKVYDVTKKIISDHVLTKVPKIEDYCQHLIMRFLQAQGIGTVENFVYLRKGIKSTIENSLLQMLENKQVEKISINQQVYYILSENLLLLNKRLTKKIHILSPFDNMVIQRKRLRDLFDFDFQIECYVPASKRKYGYFCLPILFGDDLVGRIDCKAHRDQQLLRVNNIYIEKNIHNKQDFDAKLQHALLDFAHFNGCKEFSIIGYS